jgi:hypothetical protein
MGLQVGNVARGYLNDRMQSDRPERTITFSVRLTEGQNAKLKFLANRFGDSKSAVAQKLLDAAMEDAMRSMGSLEIDRDGAEPNPDAANRKIDIKVREYRREIQRIFEEDVRAESAEG